MKKAKDEREREKERKRERERERGEGIVVQRVTTHKSCVENEIFPRIWFTNII